MHLERIETPGIAHYAWLLVSDGEALIVDPSRQIDRYTERVAAMGAKLAYILETHRHEDFVMGSKALAERTGAEVVHTDADTFGHPGRELDDGESIPLGELTVRCLHTPGHTPESVCWAVFVGDDEEAYCVFTGDTLFFGETGRTDLPDEDRAVQNAARLYDSVHDKLADLGDRALICPAHGPGSVCGSGMADRPWSTLAQEKEENPVFTKDRATFAADKGGERLPRPPYFRHMEQVNREGGLPPFEAGSVARLPVEAFAERVDGAVVIDTRSVEGFAAAHLPDALSVWQGGLSVFGGWVASCDDRILLVTEDDEQVDEAVLALARIGLDGVEAALSGGFASWRDAGRPLAHAAVLAPRDLHEQLDAWPVVDVREPDEYAQGHIPGAHRAYVGHLPDALSDAELDRDEPLVVTCGVGHRASVAVGLLQRAGYRRVHNLLGGMSAWKTLELPLEQGDP